MTAPAWDALARMRRGDAAIDCDIVADHIAALEARNRKLVDRLLRIADDIAVAGINGFGNAIRAAIEENDDGK